MKESAPEWSSATESPREVRDGCEDGRSAVAPELKGRKRTQVEPFRRRRESAQGFVMSPMSGGFGRKMSGTADLHKSVSLFSDETDF